MSSDYDQEFVRHLLKAVFNREDLEEVAKLNTVKHLYRPKWQITKGIDFGRITSCKMQQN